MEQARSQMPAVVVVNAHRFLVLPIADDAADLLDDGFSLCTGEL